MYLSERLLLLFCKKNVLLREVSYSDWTVDTALNLLNRVYVDFKSTVFDKDVLDFGCGEGYQSIGMAMIGAKHVVGVEINDRFRDVMSRLIEKYSLHNKVSAEKYIDNSVPRKFDIIISQNSFEHFDKPRVVMDTFKKLIKSDGKILITFGPPWFAPYGSHMQYFTGVPWVNLFFSERTVMRVRSRYRSDGANKYTEVESGLNKMTITKFKRIVQESGLKVQYLHLECSKGFNFMGKLPLLRELFVNRISCILSN